MHHPKDILHFHNIHPKKSLGQNFLFDENVLDRIVEAADLQPTDSVLEVGPGLGHLTLRLAETAVSVTAVELDDRFLPILNNQFDPLDHVSIIHGDILKQDPASLFDCPYKVIANVPYYITGAILRHLLSAPHKPTMMVLTVQKEVAERITAVPPKMSLLSVSTQFYGAVSFVSTLKAGSFWPRPDVDSAAIKIDLSGKRPLPFSEEAAFFRLVKVGFSQKRKQLQKNLRQLGLEKATIQDILTQSEIDGTRRAETLTIDEWVRLYKNTK